MKKILILLLFLVPLQCVAAEVDYFAEFEKLYIDKLNPPEDNGQRLMIAAIGPRILEQSALANAVPWEQMPTHEHGKNWFENRWKPLCEHMSIDPYKKPMFYDSRSFYSSLEKFEKASKNFNNDSDGQKLWTHLAGAPWTHEQYPEIAAWLQDRNVVLDLFGRCVRKPNYVCWRQMSEEPGGMYAILLPEVQANREFARDLRIRITERLGKGDTDGAWYDVMSMLILGRKHFKSQPLIVTNLVGAAIELQGYQAARFVLRSGNLTKEQLEKFSKDLQSLPPGNTYYDGFLTELYMIFDSITLFRTNRDGFLELYQDVLSFNVDNEGAAEADVIKKFGDKSINDEIVRKQILKRKDESKPERITYEELFANRFLRRQYVEKIDVTIDDVRKSLRERFKDKTVFDQEESRSKFLADWIYIFTAASMLSVDKLYCNCDSELVLLKIAVALESYKIDHGDYPEKLESLLLDYLDEVPIDPSTSRSTISYKKDGGENGKFLLYSYGVNQKDDGGKENKENRNEGDIVF